MSHSKIILITGVSKGLGRALANEFSSPDHLIIGCGRNANQIDSLRKEYQTDCDFQALDISSHQAVEKWSKNLIKTYGPPDLILNNAAIINSNAPLWKVPAEEIDQTIDINIKGVTHIIRNFLPAMIDRKSGIVVNFSSYWGSSTAPDVAPYCATKWAIEGLTQALAQELPQGLAAVIFNPGVINTDMLQSCFGSSASQYPSPSEWAKRAAPLLLKLTTANNGKTIVAS